VIGKHFLNLDIGLPVAELHVPLRQTLAGEDGRELTVAGRDRRGRGVALHIALMPLVRDAGTSNGVIMLMRPDGTDGSKP
jgi:two-component system, chemotaxis family, CheB/CheR fusion protein